MSTANLFNRDVSANKSPRNAFNMSYSTLFSSPAGMLLPCYVQEVKRNDKLKVGVNSLTRTAPLVTPAFMSFDEKVDFWFVPNYLLWSDYDNWTIAQTYRHRTTQLKGTGVQNFLPFTSFASIARFFESRLTSYPFRQGWNSPTPVSALRYLDLLGYSVPNVKALYSTLNYSSRFESAQDPTSTDPIAPVDVLVSFYDNLSRFAPCNYFRLAAFQCIYQHAYRNEEYEKLDPSFYNMDNLFSGLSTDNSVPSSVKPTLSTNYDLSVSESINNSASTLSNRVTLDKLFTPRYKNWRKDVFTAAKPTYGFANGSIGLQIPDLGESSFSSTYGSGFYWPSLDPNKFNPINGDQGPTPNAFNPLSAPNADAQGYDYDRIDWTFQTDGDSANVVQRLYTQILIGQGGNYGLTFLYPQNIRNLMSQDKYVRAAIYADKDLSSQIKALFGVEKPDPHKPRYLGSYSADVTIDDVTATSDGTGPGDSTSILGQLAGKVRQGNGDGSVFSAHFDDDGIVIGVHYVMPRNNYDSYRLNKWNTKISRFDYFSPYFDGLGLQPVLSYERFIDYSSFSGGVYYPSSVFGFAPRYYEYKQRQNEVHGGFQFDQFDSYWTLTNNFPLANQISADRPEIFKIIPNITDRIFNVKFDGGIKTDPFQHYYYFDATLVSDMEVYGTPSL